MTIKRWIEIRKEIEDHGRFLSPGAESLWALGILCATAKETGIKIPTPSFEEMKKVIDRAEVIK